MVEWKRGLQQKKRERSSRDDYSTRLVSGHVDTGARNRNVIILCLIYGVAREGDEDRFDRHFSWWKDAGEIFEHDISSFFFFFAIG